MQSRYKRIVHFIREQYGGDVEGQRTFLQKGMYFCVTSGLGWIMSMAILWTMVKLGVDSVFYANMTGDLVAVTYVYIISVRSIFIHNNKHLMLKYITWIIYQLVLINIISVLTSASAEVLVNFGWVPSLSLAALTGKCIITPFALLTNFLFAHFLLERITKDTTEEPYNAG